MPDDKRPKPPAWLSTAGSRNARSGARVRPAASTRVLPAAAPPTHARQPAVATRRTARRAPQAVALSDNARVVLERRYLAKDAAGKLIETPEQLFRRVAHNIALAEARFAPSGAADATVDRYEAAFFDLMTSLRFLPNSPTLGNAGRAMQQLSACFVLPVEDSMEGIFESLKDTALIHQSGGGTGFAFSRLRPAGDIVASTGGVASGPVSFMRVYDAATESIKQGGTRRGANMAILDVDHPDIDAFIDVKSDMRTLQNFNISVAVTERFLEAVERDEAYDLVNPRTQQVAGSKNARAVFRRIIENAWRNGDPGLVFLDRINRDNPTPQLGRIEATNPCGEQPLLPYESCNLGSLNLAKFVRGANSVAQASALEESPRRPARGRRGANSVAQASALEESPRRPARGRREPNSVAQASPPARRARKDSAAGDADIDWDALAAAIPLCVRFLDDVIEQNQYPMREIDEMTKKTRKIGLGVMGWADLLFRLRIRYDSDDAIALAGRVMSFVQEHADRASTTLAEERGVFPAWHGSIYDPASGDPRGGPRYRNSTRTTIAPTGTLSIIADASGGIEPAFALAFMRQHHLDRKDPAKVTQLPEVNATFRTMAKHEGFLSDALIAHLAGGGSIGARDDVPDWAKDAFRTSHDIAPEWHVKMQAAFQRHTDNAVSKTINFRAEATVEDIEHAYMLAYREGCKGITVYRDGSRDDQVLSHATARGPEQAESIAAELALAMNDLLPLPLASLAPRPAGAPYRRHLPDERHSITHKFRVGEQEGYLTVGLYDDGTPGEIFVNISKEGSTIRGLMDSVAVLTSVALQYGVPLANLVAKFRGVHFEPAGLTGNAKIANASSLVDYIFRWLDQRFGEQSPAAQLADARPASSAAASPRRPARKPSPGARPAPARGAKPRTAAARAKRRSPGRSATAADPAPAAGLSAPSASAPMSTGIGCPDCGAILVFGEGCLSCGNCGYTRC